MSKYKHERQFMFSQKKINDVQVFLNDIKYLDISQIKDDKYNTVLHQCAYQGSLQIMQLYINFMIKYWRKKMITKQQLNKNMKNWVNQKNKQGFTCIHYAAYKGQIQILAYLQKIGGEIILTTNSYLSVLHLAAQGDKVKTFIYCRNKIKINSIDNKRSTALHWCAFSGSQKVSEYLLAQQNIQLNPIDSQGQTPLHLATANGNTKIVRRLLLAGADRHIKNNQGQQPIDIARQNQFHNIEKFLNDDYKCIDYLKFFMNLKMKYVPRKRQIKMPLIFNILFLLIVTFIIFGIEFKQEYSYIFYVQSGIFSIVFLLYSSLIVKPKSPKKGKYQDILTEQIRKSRYELGYQSIKKSLYTSQSSQTSLNYSNNNINLICLRCIQYKPLRSYHCDICSMCIEQYDHHCPWINNCVGKNNIFRFNLFLWLIFIVLTWIFLIAINSVLQIMGEISDQDQIFVFKQWLKQFQWVIYIFVTIATILFLFFVLPLFVLICVQFKNLFMGRTTFERFSKSNQSILSRSQTDFIRKQSTKFTQKKQKISCKNCITMCIGKSQNQTQKLLP